MAKHQYLLPDTVPPASVCNHDETSSFATVAPEEQTIQESLHLKVTGFRVTQEPMYFGRRPSLRTPADRKQV
jgi:hypothetical protein